MNALERYSSLVEQERLVYAAFGRSFLDPEKRIVMIYEKMTSLPFKGYGKDENQALNEAIDNFLNGKPALVSLKEVENLDDLLG